MKGNTTKYILKKVMEKYLPKDIIYRPKTGFGAPVRRWIKNDMKEMTHDVLSARSIENRGVFNSDAIHRLIAENDQGKIDASYTIWSLLAIETWLRQFSKN
jgi:asparagine synthase (glutamine-hydrolysing)